LDADFGLRWQDKKIYSFLNQLYKSKATNLEDKILDAQWLLYIWKPDIFIGKNPASECAVL